MVAKQSCLPVSSLLCATVLVKSLLFPATSTVTSGCYMSENDESSWRRFMLPRTSSATAGKRCVVRNSGSLARRRKRELYLQHHRIRKQDNDIFINFICLSTMG